MGRGRGGEEIMHVQYSRCAFGFVGGGGGGVLVHGMRRKGGLSTAGVCMCIC